MAAWDFTDINTSSLGPVALGLQVYISVKSLAAMI